MIVQNLNNMSNSLDQSNIVKKINLKLNSSLRELEFCLGKLNYCLKAIKDKSLIKIKNFHNNTSKLRYVYILTSKEVTQKTNLTLKFMQRKMKEHDEMKPEIEQVK